MLGLSSILCPAETVPITASTAASVAAAAASAIHGGDSPTPTPSGSTPPSPQLDKTEINDAVTKVLQGYDWTLVPIASK